MVLKATMLQCCKSVCLTAQVLWFAQKISSHVDEKEM